MNYTKYFAGRRFVRRIKSLPIYLTILAFLVSTILLGQQTDTIHNPQYGIEFFKLNTAFSQLKQTAVTISYYMSQSDKPGIIMDSTVGSYQVHDGMMKGEMDGVEFLSNRKFSISINTDDSFIAISKSQLGLGALQINMFDSLFRAVNIAGFEKSNLPGGGSQLAVSFKPTSFFKGYAINYSSDYRIEKIWLEYLDMEYDEDGLPPPAGRTKRLEILYNGYQIADFDISVFNEEHYVKKNEYGKWVGVGGYSGWQVMESEPGL